MENALYPGQIIVKTAVVDDGGQYGAKLKITDSTDKPYVVNEKHKALWPIFTDNIGKTIILNWGNWQGKTYIDKAQVMITAANMQQPVQPVPAQPVQAKTTAPVTAVAPIAFSKDASIEAQSSFKGAVELLAAKILPIDGRIGLLTQAFIITRLEDSLKPEMVSLCNNMVKTDAKEAAKPKVKAEPK